MLKLWYLITYIHIITFAIYCSLPWCIFGYNLYTYIVILYEYTKVCLVFHIYDIYMDVSENSGTPKSSILIGFSIINHPFWGTPIFGNTHICKWWLADVTILMHKTSTSSASFQEGHSAPSFPSSPVAAPPVQSSAFGVKRGREKGSIFFFEKSNLKVKSIIFSGLYARMKDIIPEWGFAWGVSQQLIVDIFFGRKFHGCFGRKTPRMYKTQGASTELLEEAIGSQAIPAVKASPHLAGCNPASWEGIAVDSHAITTWDVSKTLLKWWDVHHQAQLVLAWFLNHRQYQVTTFIFFDLVNILTIYILKGLSTRYTKYGNFYTPLFRKHWNWHGCKIRRL